MDKTGPLWQYNSAMFIFNLLFQEMQGDGDSEEEILDEFRSKILQTRD